MSGKGDRPRKTNLKKFNDNFDQIDWSKKPKPTEENKSEGDDSRVAKSGEALFGNVNE